MRDAADITFILDRSGSMASVANDTIGGFNKFIEDQQSISCPATFTMVQFDNEYEFLYQAVPIKDVKLLDNKTFVPRGSTALLDAVGRAINETGNRLSVMKEEDRPNKVIFVILTDGQENCSSEFNHRKIADMISEQRNKYSWQFLFLGANQDAIATAGAMNISAQNAMTYASNTRGTASAYVATSSKLKNFRSSGNIDDLSYNDQDRNEQISAGA